MTNLPISNNNTQSPANGALGGASQPAPRPSEGRASGGVPVTGGRNDSSVPGNAAPTSQTNGAANDQATDSFSVLLARQIGEAGFPAMKTTQISGAIDGKTITGDADQNAQDQATIAASNPSDPANSLAAMLLQFPLQPSKDISPVSSQLLRTDPLADKESGNFPMTRGAKGVKQRAADNLQRISDTSMENDNALPKTDNRQQIDATSIILSSSNAVKHVEIAISAAGQPQASPNNPKTVTTVPSVMSNILANDIPADAAQTITTPLGNSGWADEFSQKIIWMNNQQNQTAELHLNPPDLGPLNVVLKISDNQLTAQFTSPHSAVRDAVENALPKLREILADNNITLGNATVSDQAPRDRNNGGLMDQGSGTAAQREAIYNAAKSNELESTTSQSNPARRHNGMLDTFA